MGELRSKACQHVSASEEENIQRIRRCKVLVKFISDDPVYFGPFMSLIKQGYILRQDYLAGLKYFSVNVAKYYQALRRSSIVIF